MKLLENWGGVAGFVCAATYVYGFALVLGPLAETGIGSDGADQQATLAFYSDNPALMSSWYLSI